MRELTTRLAWLLVAASLYGCGEENRATRQPTPEESGQAGSPAVDPSRALPGTWDFDPEAMRSTAEFRKQIELIESRGALPTEARRSAESAFGRLSSLQYVFTERTISISKDDHRITLDYRIVSETADTVVIRTPELQKEGVHTTIRVVDRNRIVISDDSRPDVPVWTFKRRAAPTTADREEP